MQTISVRRLARVIMVTALAATGLVAVAAAPAGASTPCQETFTSTTGTPIIQGFPMPSAPPLPPITLPMPSTSFVTVGDGTIADIDVTVQLTHPSVDQLSLSVQQGSGTAVNLKSVGGTAGANLDGTVFDDEAAQAIGTGAPPYTGRYRPSSPLSAYDGTSAGATWSLTVMNSSLSMGNIDSWSITITHPGCAPSTTPAADTDADGVPNAADSCPTLAAHTASGCPLASGAATAAYRHGAFKGGLSSSVPACQAARGVSIWKVHRGPDRLVGTRTTASDGSYTLKRAKRAGRYYVTSPRVVLGNVAECPAVTSKTFKIH